MNLPDSQELTFGILDFRPFEFVSDFGFREFELESADGRRESAVSSKSTWGAGESPIPAVGLSPHRKTWITPIVGFAKKRILRLTQRAFMSESREHNPPTQEEISRCAYYIWLHEGCPQGREREHWAQAEAQLTQRAQPSPVPQKEGRAPNHETAAVSKEVKAASSAPGSAEAPLGSGSRASTATGTAVGTSGNYGEGPTARGSSKRSKPAPSPSSPGL